MTVTPYCTAPIDGHKSAYVAALCPLHRQQQSRSVLSPPNLPSLPVGDRAAIAQNPDTPLDTALRLVKDGSMKVRTALAKRDDLPEEVLLRLCNDKHEDVRAEIAMRSDCPADVLDDLATDENSRVRYLTLANPSCPEGRLREAFAATGDIDARRGVARNPSSPPEMLEALAREAAGFDRSRGGSMNSLDDYIRLNPALPPAALATLARAESDDTAKYVARNPNMPLTSLEALASDRKAAVRAAAAENPSLPTASRDALFAEGSDTVDTGLAKNPNLPHEWFHTLRERSHVDSYILANPGAPDSLIATIANEKDGYYRDEAAAASKRRIADRFDIDEDNDEALDRVRDLEWWKLDADDAEVAMISALFRDK